MYLLISLLFLSSRPELLTMYGASAMEQSKPKLAFMGRPKSKAGPKPVAVQRDILSFMRLKSSDAPPPIADAQGSPTSSAVDDEDATPHSAGRIVIGASPTSQALSDHAWPQNVPVPSDEDIFGRLLPADFGLLSPMEELEASLQPPKDEEKEKGPAVSSEVPEGSSGAAAERRRMAWWANPEVAGGFDGDGFGEQGLVEHSLSANAQEAADDKTTTRASVEEAAVAAGNKKKKKASLVDAPVAAGKKKKTHASVEESSVAAGRKKKKRKHALVVNVVEHASVASLVDASVTAGKKKKKKKHALVVDVAAGNKKKKKASLVDASMTTGKKKKKRKHALVGEALGVAVAPVEEQIAAEAAPVAVKETAAEDAHVDEVSRAESKKRKKKHNKRKGNKARGLKWAQPKEEQPTEKTSEEEQPTQERLELIVEAGMSDLPPVPLVCNRCKKQVDPARCQVTGKSAGCWRCNTCNTRATQLSRIPEWKAFQPTMKGFSAEEREDFWKSIERADSNVALRKVMSEKITKKHTETNSRGNKARYLPLSVYHAQGYDTDAIEAHCMDWLPCKMFGKIYAVDVQHKDWLASDSNEHLKELLGTSDLGAPASSSGPAPAASSNQGGGGGKGGGGDQVAGGEPPEPPPSANSLKKDRSLATRILAKIATVMVPLQSTLKSKKLSSLPEFAVKAAQDALSELKSMETNASKGIGGTAKLEHTMVDANDSVPRLLLLMCVACHSDICSFSFIAVPTARSL